VGLVLLVIFGPSLLREGEEYRDVKRRDDADQKSE